MLDNRGLHTPGSSGLMARAMTFAAQRKHEQSHYEQASKNSSSSSSSFMDSVDIAGQFDYSGKSSAALRADGVGRISTTGKMLPSPRPKSPREFERLIHRAKYSDIGEPS